jgi:hypothetical protein
MKQVTVGRIVRFIDPRSPEVSVAIVTYVLPPDKCPAGYGQAVHLTIFNPNGVPQGLVGVPENQEKTRGPSWHWPEEQERGPDTLEVAALFDKATETMEAMSLAIANLSTQLQDQQAKIEALEATLAPVETSVESE